MDDHSPPTATVELLREEFSRPAGLNKRYAGEEEEEEKEGEGGGGGGGGIARCQAR